MITRSAPCSRCCAPAEKAAASTIPVLIDGESGVGKELIARAIHGSGERARQTLRRGQLRRHAGEPRRVDPVRPREGRLHRRHRKAHRQIRRSRRRHAVPRRSRRTAAAAQVKLLRALQEGEVEPVGGRKTVKVDVRIVSATNRDLIADVKAGRFREDLFYRLHVFPISVPPLRTRREDIPELARHFLARFAAEEGKRVRAIEPRGARAADRLSLAGQCAPARERDLPRGRAGRRRGVRHRRIPADCRANRLATGRVIAASRIEPSPAIVAAWPDARELVRRDRRSAHSLRLTDAQGDMRPLEDIERDAIRFAISHYRGQMSEVARRLRIGRSTLYRKLEGLGLERRLRKRAGNPRISGALAYRCCTAKIPQGSSSNA